MFCPKCGSLLKRLEVNGKKLMGCSCGFQQDKKGSATITEKSGAKEVELIEEIETKPLVDEHCEKCGHGKAYFWSMQTRAADEPETRFFKCEKCKHTWREYS
jgi:transcription factor S